MSNESETPQPVPGDICGFQIVDTEGNVIRVCGLPYAITPENSRLFNFLEYPTANHIEAHCPVGHEDNIFVTTEVFLHILKVCKLSVVFGLVPSASFKEVADRVVHGPEVREPKEIDVPHWMLRELYDQLREFEGGN